MTPPRGLSAATPRFRLWSFLVLAALAGGLIGCQRRAPQAEAAPPPTIPVSQPVEREVTDFTEYTGRTDAVESVTVRPRVTGELKKMPFKEGSDVRGPVKLFGAVLRPGDLLFTVDPEPYQASYDQADGQLKLYKAQKVLAEVNYAQDKQGYDAGAVSIFQMNQDKATIDQADARIKSAEATLKSAQLNLDFCTIRAPISGRISRYYYTTGNLVSANSTMLTTIVTMDKMYGYFDVEERTFQRIVSSMAAGLSPISLRTGLEYGISAVRLVRPEAVPPVIVRMGIEGDASKDPYPYRGQLNFVNNQVNPSTGTVALRAVFENQRAAGGMWKMLPGMFVRIRLDLGLPHRSALVIDRAIGSDQGLKYVYVIDAENKVQSRRVVTGSLQEDGLRVIEPYQPKSATNPQETGIKKDEWVVVGGLPQLRPRLEIKPDRVPMPTADNDTTQRRIKGPTPGEKPNDKSGDKKSGDKTK
jgi:multidrug efflux system membrane fusion protein